MKTIIEGGSLPVVTCILNKGEQIYSENGGMSWMDGNVKMETTTGGIFKGVGRVLSGDSFFMNVFTALKDDASISFTSCFPGKIMELDLEEHASIVCQKKAFLCAERTVDLKLEFRKKLGAGFFGGEGFIMQRLTGPGKAFIEIDGSVIKKEIKPGEILKVDTGHVVAFTGNIDLSVELLKGAKNLLFNSEGFFMTTLKGEGVVWLQTMPIYKIFHS